MMLKIIDAHDLMYSRCMECKETQKGLIPPPCLEVIFVKKKRKKDISCKLVARGFCGYRLLYLYAESESSWLHVGVVTCF